MSPWRAEAFARFPDLVDRFREADEFGEGENASHLWHILWESFAEAYKTPRNEDMIQRVYAYCRWSLGQPAGTTAEDDPGSIISVCFFESIPTLPEAVDDMPRWWSRSDVVATKEIFSYMVGEEGFAKILARFDRPSDIPQSNDAT